MVDFDYVIVGAGAAGCVLASRLSEDPGNQVLLEYGGPDTNPLLYGALLAPWFARHTVAELAAVFAGTSVQWAHLYIPTGSVLPHGWRA